MSERHPLTRFALSALPFSDAGSMGLPLGQLLRLSLFQVSVGMAAVMLLGTLNRVMIVELGLAAALVAAMIALPVLVAPFRALLGHRSDTHRSAIGWKRLPYLWFGALWQFGGLSIMPFALLILGGYAQVDVPYAGEAAAALAFAVTGLGMHMTQTAGLALAADRADPEARPRVVALLWVAFLVGMMVSALLIGWLLRDFTPLKLIQVLQGAAVATLALNLVALWKQESLAPSTADERAAPRPRLRDAWGDLASGGRAGRLLAVIFVGTFAFAMQDVLLEPYGGAVLGLPVAATTLLTATWAAGALAAFGLAGRRLARGAPPMSLAAQGAALGIGAFAAVIAAGPLGSTALFFAGAAGIGFGGGLFAVATLIEAMALPDGGSALPGGARGLALGAWGAAQATAQGLATAAGGGLRDASSGLMPQAHAATPYAIVYGTEIALLALAVVLVAPLRRARAPRRPERLGLADFPT